MTKVTIVETGLANLASVSAAFRRLGKAVTTTRCPQAVRDETYLVLPGVGRFEAGMASLVKGGLVDAIAERVNANLPTLAICLGLQLLCESSEESPGCRGMGLISAPITTFSDDVRRPQFGWNWISNENTSVLAEGGFVYYANSYRLAKPPTGWRYGLSDYGGSFVGCLEKDQLLACQFHPELSGSYGSKILERWLTKAEEGQC